MLKILTLISIITGISGIGLILLRKSDLNSILRLGMSYGIGSSVFFLYSILFYKIPSAFFFLWIFTIAGNIYLLFFILKNCKKLIWLFFILIPLCIILYFSIQVPIYGWDVYRSIFPRFLSLYLNKKIYFANGITHPMFLEFFLTSVANMIVENNILENFHYYKIFTGISIIFIYILLYSNKRKSIGNIIIFLLILSPIFLKHIQIFYTNLIFTYFVITYFILVNFYYQKKSFSLTILTTLLGIVMCQVRRIASVYLILLNIFYAIFYLLRKKKKTEIFTKLIIGFLPLITIYIWNYIVEMHRSEIILMSIVQNIGERISDKDYLEILKTDIIYFFLSYFSLLKDSIGGIFSENFGAGWYVILASFILRNKNKKDFLFYSVIFGGINFTFIFLTFLVNQYHILHSINRYLMPLFILTLYWESRDNFLAIRDIPLSKKSTRSGIGT